MKIQYEPASKKDGNGKCYYLFGRASRRQEFFHHTDTGNLRTTASKMEHVENMSTGSSRRRSARNVGIDHPSKSNTRDSVLAALVCFIEGTQWDGKSNKYCFLGWAWLRNRRQEAEIVGVPSYSPERYLRGRWRW
jgi:hypothetical protein